MERVPPPKNRMAEVGVNKGGCGGGGGAKSWTWVAMRTETRHNMLYHPCYDHPQRMHMQ